MTRQRYYTGLKPWWWMRNEGLLDEVVLRKDSFLTNAQIMKLNWRYYDKPIPNKIERDTLFWYEPGRHSDGPEIAGIYLKNVIHPDIRRRAFNALDGFEWHPPHRPETKTAKHRQRGKGRVAAKELHFGHAHLRQLTKSTLFREQGAQFAKLEELLSTLNAIFKRVLPNQWAAQNTPKSMREKLLEDKKKEPHWGGIPWRFRIFLTAFSNITLLKSCPAAIHKDSNGRGTIPNFSCLTSVGEGFEGGTFCLLEYGLKVPVTPGDILICQSTREWHTNIGAVEGLKYSIVAYYKQPLPSLRIKAGSSMPEETYGMRLLDKHMAMGPQEKGDLLAKGISKLMSKRK
jgi:hypothetical protein